MAESTRNRTTLRRERRKCARRRNLRVWKSGHVIRSPVASGTVIAILIDECCFHFCCQRRHRSQQWGRHHELSPARRDDFIIGNLANSQPVFHSKQSITIAPSLPEAPLLLIICRCASISSAFVRPALLRNLRGARRGMAMDNARAAQDSRDRDVCLFDEADTRDVIRFFNDSGKFKYTRFVFSKTGLQDFSMQEPLCRSPF